MKSYQLHRSFAKTMQLFVVTGDGSIATVEECPSKAFAALIAVSAPTIAGDPAVVTSQLIGLDYVHMADRWFALELLSEHGAKIPLFSTPDEAKRSIVTPTTQ